MDIPKHEMTSVPEYPYPDKADKANSIMDKALRGRSTVKGTSRRSPAKFACTYCHARKVRCDLTIRGAPCTNCTLDSISCHVYSTKIQTPLHQDRPRRSTKRDIRFPDYLLPTPLHLSHTDYMHCKRKGALELPPRTTIDHLCTAYFEYVHPIMPVINKKETVQSMQRPAGGAKISLLLLHCMMFAAELFLTAHKEQRGPSTTSSASLHKARILYDIGWETDPLTLIQCLILMTFSPTTDDGPKGPAFWLTQAISLAYREGLNRNPVSLHISPTQQSLRKRIWWVVYLRERMMTIDIATPWTISKLDHDVPMLALADFEPDSPSQTGSSTSPSPWNGDHAPHYGLLAMILVEKCKLAVLLGLLVPISLSYRDWSGRLIQHHRPQAQCKAPPPSCN